MRTALEPREPDRIPLDFGSTNLAGIHVSCVAALRDYYGLAPGPVKVYEPFQMLGWIDDDLHAAMGLDVTGVFPRKTACRMVSMSWYRRTSEKATAPGYWETSASGRRYSREFILGTLEQNPPVDTTAAGWAGWRRIWQSRGP